MVKVEAPCLTSTPGQKKVNGSTPRDCPEVPAGAAAVGFEENKLPSLLVIDEFSEVEAGAGVEDEGAGAGDDPKIRSVEQPADRPASASARAEPKQRRGNFRSVLKIAIARITPNGQFHCTRFL